MKMRQIGKSVNVLCGTIALSSIADRLQPPAYAQARPTPLHRSPRRVEGKALIALATEATSAPFTNQRLRPRP